MTHRYYLLNRPPFIGTHPQGEVSREVWQPSRLIPEEHNVGERYAHGWVEYPAPLEPVVVARYELWPADVRERGSYTISLIRQAPKVRPRFAELFRVSISFGIPGMSAQAVVHNRDQSIHFVTPCTVELREAVGSLNTAFFYGAAGEGEVDLYVDRVEPWPNW